MSRLKFFLIMHLYQEACFQLSKFELSRFPCISILLILNVQTFQTMRYIRLLLADEDLANLLIMSLPERIMSKLTESPVKPKPVKLNLAQNHLVQRIKVKHLKKG